MANLFSEKPIVEIVAVPGRDGTDIPIDDRLSDTSENPVQNKVVKQAIDNAVSVTEDFATQAVEAAYGQLDEAKQDVLDDSGAGQNIKTINGESILGTGNLEVGSQIDVDDALNPTSENPVQNRALYQAFNELNNDVIGEVSRLANRVYGYTHEAIVTDDLENDYNLIINGGYQRLYNPPIDWETEYASYYYKDGAKYRLNVSATWDWTTEYYKRYTPNSDLANVSAVGMLAVLNHGVYTAVSTQPDDWETNYDKYFYLTSEGYIFNTDSTWNPNRSYYSYSGDAVRTQGNRLFINGDESDGYTFRGVNSQNGIEIVKIWYFENENQLDLSQECNYFVSAVNVKAKQVQPQIDATYLGCINDFVTENYFPTVTFFAKNVNEKSGILTGGVNRGIIPNSVVNCYSATSEVQSTASAFWLSTTAPNAKRIFLPNCTVLTVSGIKNFPYAEIIFSDELESVGTANNTNATFATFNNVGTVALPESVSFVGRNVFNNCKNIILKCKDAEFAHAQWTYTTPTTFVMYSDWAASFSIATAAKNIWGQEQFNSLISVEGNLRNVGFVSAPNNNGDADYDSATDTYTRNDANTGAYNTARWLTFPATNYTALSQELIDLAFSKGWKIQGG